MCDLRRVAVGLMQKRHDWESGFELARERARRRRQTAQHAIGAAPAAGSEQANDPAVASEAIHAATAASQCEGTAASQREATGTSASERPDGRPAP
jgi:hypothetical protein